MIYFEHPGFELLIKHDIEAEQFKAAIRFLSLAATIDVLKLWLHCDDSLDHNSFNFFPNLRCRLGCPRLSFFARWLSHYAFEAIVEPEFMCVIIKFFILLI